MRWKAPLYFIPTTDSAERIQVCPAQPARAQGLAADRLRISWTDGNHAAEDPATAKQKKKKQAAAKAPYSKPVAENRKARHRYEVLETLECGIALVGSEVKSLRDGKLSLDEAYGRMRNGEVWLVGCDIPEYSHANQFNHDPRRPRKLLLHRREIRKFAARAYEKGLTLVPLKVYFNEEGRAKVLLGICRGRQLYDKRQALKKADAKRDMERAIKRKA